MWIKLIICIVLNLFCIINSFANHDIKKQNEKKSLLKKTSIFASSVYLPRDNSHRFVTETSDKRNALYLNGILDWHSDVFENANGLSLNLGNASQSIINQNTVLRSWLYMVGPVIEAKLDENIHFFTTPDFGQQQFRVFDIETDVNYWRMFSLMLGFQKSLISGLENFIFPNTFNYVSFPSLMSPSREVALTLYGSIGPRRAHPYTINSYLGFDDWFSYQFAMTNGNADASFPGLVPFRVSNLGYLYQSSTFNTGNKAFEARVFFNPFIHYEGHLFEKFGIGFAGSTMTVVNQVGLPAFLSIGKNVIFQFGAHETTPVAQGLRTRIHPQFVWSQEHWGVIGDYVQSFQHLSLNMWSHVLSYTPDVITQKNHAGEVQWLFNLTGEHFDFRTLKPFRNFRPFDKEAIGAFQLGVRFSWINLDPSVFNDFYLDHRGHQQYLYADPRVSVSNAKAFGLVLNWYWNQNLFFSTEFSKTKFKGGCSTGAFNDPISPGCQTASNDYISQPGSQVINRPNEVVFLQHMFIMF